MRGASTSFKIFLALTLLLGALGAVNVNSCQDLSSSSTTYDLTQDVNLPMARSVCFNIMADDITLDCHGHLISIGVSGPGTKYGVNSTYHDDVTIKNCRINNYNYGIYLHRNDDHLVKNNTCYSNVDSGIQLNEISDSEIEGNTCYDNTYGIDVGQTTTNSNFTDNTVYSNSKHGFRVYGPLTGPAGVQNGLLFEDNNASYNTLAGALFQNVVYGNEFDNFTAHDNAVGLNATNEAGTSYSSTNQNTIANSEFTDNTNYGILLDTGVVFSAENTSISGSTEGIRIEEAEDSAFTNVSVEVKSTGAARCVALHGADDNAFQNGGCFGDAGYSNTNNYFFLVNGSDNVNISSYNFSYQGGSEAKQPAMILANNSNGLNVSYSNFSDDNGMSYDEPMIPGSAADFHAIRFEDGEPNAGSLAGAFIHDNDFDNFTKAIYVDYDELDSGEYTTLNVSYNAIRGYPDSSTSSGITFETVYAGVSGSVQDPFKDYLVLGNECTDLGEARYCVEFKVEAQSEGDGYDSYNNDVQGLRFANSSGVLVHQPNTASKTGEMQSTWRDSKFKDNRAAGACDYGLYFNFSNSDASNDNGSIYNFYDYGSNYSYCDEHGVYFYATNQSTLDKSVIHNTEMDGDNPGKYYNIFDYVWFELVNVTVNDTEVGPEHTVSNPSNVTKKWTVYSRLLKYDDTPVDGGVLNATLYRDSISGYTYETVFNSSTNSTGYAPPVNMTDWIFDDSLMGGFQMYYSDNYFNGSNWGNDGLNDNTWNYFEMKNYNYYNPVEIILGNCPGEVSSSMTLTRDYYSGSGVCFNITAADVEIDCDGHTITGQGEGAGIYNKDNSGLNVTNCEILNFDAAVSIVGDSADNAWLYENDFWNNSAGLSLTGADYANFSYNNASHNENPYGLPAYASDYASYNMSGNVLLYHFNEGDVSEPWSIEDYSGNNNPGKSNGAEPVENGQLRGALYFNGSERDYVTLYSQARFEKEEDFTWAFWFNSTYVSDQDFSMFFTDKLHYEYLMLNKWGYLALYAENGTQASSGTQLVANTWHHVAVVRNSSATMFYINGELDTYSTNVAYDFGIGYLGANNDIYNGFYPNHFYNGSMDELALFNRALEPEEVHELYEYSGQGIHVQTSSDNNNVSRNYFEHNDVGVSLQTDDCYTTTSWNEANENNEYGIHLSTSDYNNVSYNNASYNGAGGISLWLSENNNVSHNNATYNDATHPVAAAGNNANAFGGIGLNNYRSWTSTVLQTGESDYNWITFNNASYNTVSALVARYTAHNNISYNEFTDSRFGCYSSYYFANNNVSYNDFSRSTAGDGLMFHGTQNNGSTISNNTFEDSFRVGFWIWANNGGNVLYNNTFNANNNVRVNGGASNNRFYHNYFYGGSGYHFWTNCSYDSEKDYFNTTIGGAGQGNYYEELPSQIFDSDGDGWADEEWHVENGLPLNGSWSYWTENSNQEDNACYDAAPHTNRGKIWHIYYGNWSARLLAADVSVTNFTKWNSTEGFIYFADDDATIDWASLVAIGWKPGGSRADDDDFADLDDEFNAAPYEESITKLWDSDNDGEGDDERSVTVFGNSISGVPFANSTNNTNFKTGILWDSSDGGTEYDESQETVFFTFINMTRDCAYTDTCDYEIRIPGNLGGQVGGGDTVQIYVEVL